jgi:hypothetical protein
MKERQGFVSNSSSGSFIMHWRMRTFGKIVTAQRAIGEVFGVYFKEGTDEIDWENTWNKESKVKVEEAIEHTITNVDGSFTSTFSTSMVNGPEDFGEAAKSLVMGIVANEYDGFEIIDTRVENDGN